MPGSDSTEVIVLDLRGDAMQARRKEGRAKRARRQGVVLKALLGAVLLLVAVVTLIAVISA